METTLMIQRLALLSVALFLFGCSSTPYVSPNAPVDRPAVVSRKSLSNYETAIRPYIRKAQATYPAARERFEQGLPPKHSFFVTTRLYDRQGRFEQVFVAVRSIKEKTIHGILFSPVQLADVPLREGDRITVSEADILDWTITTPDGREEGNYVGKFLDTYNR